MNMLLPASYINPPKFCDFILFRAIVPAKLGTCPPWQLAGALRQVPAMEDTEERRRELWGITSLLLE